MAGKSNKEMHPFMAKLLKRASCETLTDLSKLAEEKGQPIARSTIDTYAFDGRVPTLPNAKKLSLLTGVPAVKIMEGFSDLDLAS